MGIEEVIICTTKRYILFRLLGLFLKLSRMNMKIDFNKSLLSKKNSIVLNPSSNHSRIIVVDLICDLEYLLKAVTNLKRLRLREYLKLNNMINEFEQIAELLIRLALGLKIFGCEWYYNVSNRNDKLLIIRHLHPLCNNIQSVVGPYENLCHELLDICSDPETHH